MTLGQIIRAWRDSHGQSMAEFARASGLSKAYISVLERDHNPSTGKPPVPSLEAVRAAAAAMGQEPMALLAALSEGAPAPILFPAGHGGGALAQLLGELMLRRGLSAAELAAAAGVPQQAVEQLLEGGAAAPPPALLQALAGVLAAPAGGAARPRLSLEERQRRERMQALDSYGRRAVQELIDRMNEAVDALLGLESQRVRENSDAATAFGGEERCFSLPLYDIKVSAGTGQFLDSDHYEVVELRDPPPRGTSFMVQVAGDSMEPQIHDGDRLFVCRQPQVRETEIGVFCLDGDVYVKEFWGSHLSSLNPAYGDIELAQFETVRCYGKVLGVCRA